MRKNSIKNVRINAEVQRALSEIIRDDVKDPRISPLFSVTKVYVAPDLKSCKAYISVIGSSEELDATIQGLKSADGFIRMKLARTVNLRNRPELRFKPRPEKLYRCRAPGYQGVSLAGGIQQFF